MIKIALIDDNPAVLLGVRAAIESHDEIDLIFTNNKTNAFLLNLEEHEVDVLIVDIVLDNVIGLNFLDDLRKKFQTKPIIAFSNAQGKSIELYLEEIGINHLVSKKEPIDVLIDAILEFRDFVFIEKEPTKKDSIVLSDREFEILTFLGKGFSSTEIAENINLSQHTVNFHKKKLLKKFNVDSIAKMIRDAVDLGIYRE